MKILKNSLEKKIIVFLVEGPTDKMSLGISFDKLFSKHRIKPIVLNTDICTSYEYDQAKLKSTIKKIVQEEVGIDERIVKKKDIYRIVHLVDTDAAFIDSQNIIEDNTCTEVIYKNNCIHHFDKASIVERNERKQRAINNLCSIASIWKDIPYSVYFMSCNLEHVLFDIQNCKQEDKRKYANEFIENYARFPDKFIEYMNNSVFSIRMAYLDSWNFIKRDNHSIGRYCNLCICINEILNECYD